MAVRRRACGSSRGGRGSWIRLALPRAPGFSVARWDQELPGVGGIDQLDASEESTFFYDEAAQMLYLKIAAPDNDYEEIGITGG